MKKRSGFRPFALSILFAFILISCNRNNSQIVLETQAVTGIAYTTAASGANVINKKGAGLTSRGVCWSLTPEPTAREYKTDEGAGKGGFVSNLKGLKPGTTYYIRAYAIRENDTIYGNVISFSTENFGAVTDIEGNEYKTITAGNRTWMAENLRTTRYADSTLIPNIKDAAKWASLTSPGYCWFKNSEAAFKTMYGAIYNWYTVNTGKLCPEGWHVPTDDDWKGLSAALGGDLVAGGKLKQTGDSYWQTPNTGASNEYLFTALPGGLRYLDGEFRDFGFGGYWWTSTEFSPERAIFRFAFYQDANLFRFDNDKKNGFYVRCVKD